MQVPATNPSRVCLMSAKRKRSYDVAMKLQAVDVAEITSKEAAATQFGRFNGVYMARAQQREINAGPV